MATIHCRIRPGVGARRERAPRLERWLARGAPAAAADWRARAYGCLTTAAAPSSPPTVSPAAAAAQVAFGALPEATVCLFDPIHAVAGLTHVSLPPDGLLALAADEAAALAADFGRAFAGGDARLLADSGGRLYGLLDGAWQVEACEPCEVLGCDLWERRARGADAPRLRRLVTELELWLHDHALNRARTARGAPAVTSLWPWGFGRAQGEAAAALAGFAAGGDPQFAAAVQVREFPQAPLAAAGGVVIVDAAPGAPAWPAAEAAWLAPALDALRGGLIEAVEISLGSMCVRIPRRGWRWWRPRRPWWRTFAVEGLQDEAD